MNVPHQTFGPMLRAHRVGRALSQERLADRAEVSPRHLSCLETGKAGPSREMVLILGSALDLPLRDRNELLGAAGFAPVYAEAGLDGASAEPVRRAIEHLLRAHEPYGAVLCDRDFNVLRMNEGAGRLFAWASEGCSAPAEVWSNVMRATVTPGAMRERIENYAEVAAELAARVLRERDIERDPGRRARLDALLSQMDAPRVPAPGAGTMPALVVRVRRGERTLRLFTTLTTLGTPTDVTAQELRIESYFPADEATERWIRDAAGEVPPRGVSQ